MKIGALHCVTISQRSIMHIGRVLTIRLAYPSRGRAA